MGAKRLYSLDERCAEADCDRAISCKGLCAKHYQRLRTVELGPRWSRNTGRLCVAPGCDRFAISRDLCGAHYLRWRNGKGLTIVPRLTACKEPDCERKYHARGMCQYHYRKAMLKK